MSKASKAIEHYLSDSLLRQKLFDKVFCGTDQLDPDDCWEWKSGRARAGAGIMRLKMEDGDKVTVMVSRVSYMLVNGIVGSDTLVCHSCDNPPCFNPNHLFPGTYEDNVHDMIRKGRKVVKRGMENPTSILTDDDVLEIIKMRDDGKTGIEIARSFDIPDSAVYRILNGKLWIGVTGIKRKNPLLEKWERSQEILRLSTDGMTTRDIADRFGMSVSRVNRIKNGDFKTVPKRPIFHPDFA